LGSVADHGVVVTHKVMGVDDGMGTFAGNVVNDGGETTKVSGVERSGEASCGGRHAFHEEGNTEGVESLSDEVL